MNNFDSIIIQGDLRVIGDVSGAFVTGISSSTGPNFNSVGTPTVTPTISNGNADFRFDYMKGYCGPRGFCGPLGPSGYQGVRGYCGPQGPSGYQGEYGFCGPRGALGNQGDKGFCGPRGPSGSKGPTGSAGTIGSTILTSIEYDHHSSKTVNKTSLTTANWYNFESWSSAKRYVYVVMTFANVSSSATSYALLQITNSTSGLDAQMGLFLNPAQSTSVILTFNAYNQNYRMNLKKFSDSYAVYGINVYLDWINFYYG